MTVQGMQQHEQSSVLMQEHLPPWGFTIDPAVLEIELAVEAGILTVLYKFNEKCAEARVRRVLG